MRTALVALTLLSGTFAAQAADTIPRLTGEVTYANFPALADLLKQSPKKLVALDVTIPLDNEEVDGHLSTFVLDGQFEVAYHAPSKRARVYADTGFDLVDDKYYTMRGVFRIAPPETDAGATVYSVEEIEAPNGAVFEDIPVAALKK